jgi:hypothetical protein
LRGCDSFNNIGTVITNLPVEAAVREAQWYIPPLCTTVIDGYGVTCRGHCDGHRWDIHGVDKTGGITSDADVGTTVDKLSNDSGYTIPAEPKDSWSIVDVCNGTHGGKSMLKLLWLVARPERQSKSAVTEVGEVGLLMISYKEPGGLTRHVEDVFGGGSAGGQNWLGGGRRWCVCRRGRFRG